MPGPIEMPPAVAPMRSRTDGRSESNTGPGTGSEELRRACRDFESIFVNQMMRQMRKTVPREGLFGGGRAEEIYTAMQDAEMAKTISRQRGLGLADVLYRQLSTVIGDKGGNLDRKE